MFCSVRELIKRVVWCKHSNGSHIKFRMVLSILHHLLIRNNESVFMVVPNGMADHRFPDHRTKHSRIRMVVFNCWDNSFYMPDTHYNSSAIFDKRDLFCIGNTQGFIRNNVFIKIIKNRSMVIRFLDPACFKTQYRFQCRVIVYSICFRQRSNIVYH